VVLPRETTGYHKINRVNPPKVLIIDIQPAKALHHDEFVNENPGLKTLPQRTQRKIKSKSFGRRSARMNAENTKFPFSRELAQIFTNEKILIQKIFTAAHT